MMSKLKLIQKFEISSVGHWLAVSYEWIRLQFEDNRMRCSSLAITKANQSSSSHARAELCCKLGNPVCNWMHCNLYVLILLPSPRIDLAEYVLNKCITQDEKQISIGNFSCSNPTVTPDEPVYYNFDFLVKDNQILDWMVSQESRNWNVCTHVQFKDVFHYAYVYGSPG